MPDLDLSDLDPLEAEPSADGDDLGARQNVDVVHRRLREAILHGEIPADVPLSQVQLAQRLGVSRTPLREALRLLQREGLIEGEPNRRVRVAGFSVDDLEHLYAERIAVEALGVRLTVPRLTADELRALEGHLDGIEEYSALHDYERWRVPHRAFHQGLVACGGKRLTKQITQLSDHAERYRRVYTLESAGAWAAGVEEHRAILEACQRGDPAAAADRLGRHYAHVALAVIARLDPEHEPVAVRAALRMVAQSDGAVGGKRGVA